MLLASTIVEKILSFPLFAFANVIFSFEIQIQILRVVFSSVWTLHRRRSKLWAQGAQDGVAIFLGNLVNMKAGTSAVQPGAVVKEEE